jgi:hypothetical protein
MSIYTQQINNMVEHLPEAEQQFIVELIKKISNNHSDNAKQNLNKQIPNQKKAIRDFINGINAITDEPLDEEFDEIVSSRINITRELDL